MLVIAAIRYAREHRVPLIEAYYRVKVIRRNRRERKI